jgi:membrane-bound lytic murein transglycosylase B
MVNNYINKNKIRKLTFPAVILLITILSSIKISYSTLNEKELKSKFDFFKPVIEKLETMNVDSTFIQYLLSNPNTNFDDKYIKINVTGYLKKPDYSSHYNDYSVQKSLEFIQNNYDILKNCEEKYNVSKEVITSVIWIETKHGNYLGNHHIPSVFLSTAMANQDEYIQFNIKNLHNTFEGNEAELPQLEKKINQRAEKKSKWAINELKYLEKIYHSGKIDVINLKGSWAGAFGLSQFLPSSYTRNAVDGDNDGIIDLFNVSDAIYSVANYLKTAGWGKSEKKQRKAVYSYNHSKAYVNAVLTLAQKITEKENEIQSDKEQ